MSKKVLKLYFILNWLKYFYRPDLTLKSENFCYCWPCIVWSRTFSAIVN